MKLLGISGTIIGSKTNTAVRTLLEEVGKQNPEIETELLDLRQYKVDFCDGRDPLTYTGDTKKVIDMVLAADFYVIGTPVFQASLAAPLKNLFDLIPTSALYKKVVGFVATGGTYQHYLVIENQLKPIAGYFRSYVAPSYVYIHDSQFNENKEIADPQILERISNLAKELVFLQERLGN